MKKLALFLAACLLSCITYAQTEEDSLAYVQRMDSIEQSFTYQHGIITLKNNVGVIKIPDGFKYLEPVQAEKVLVDLWGNVPGENITMGLILPENHKILSDSGYVFNVQYDAIGYVKDDDADKIDYADLLKQMKTDAIEENKQRAKDGYEPIQIIGWAAQPFYDKDRKILHWAKEVQFGEGNSHTLNYNVRVLGRKGVIVLNAISSMDNAPLVKRDINKVLDIVQFSEGQAYKDFDSGVDEVAAWTIGGLVAGKVLAKVGFFAVILKFWKVIAIAVAGGGGALWKRFRRKKEEEEVVPVPVQAPEETA